MSLTEPPRSAGRGPTLSRRLMSHMAKRGFHSPWPGTIWPEKPAPGSALPGPGPGRCPGSPEDTLGWAHWRTRRCLGLLELTTPLEYTTTGHWSQGWSFLGLRPCCCTPKPLPPPSLSSWSRPPHPGPQEWAGQCCPHRPERTRSGSAPHHTAGAQPGSGLPGKAWALTQGDAGSNPTLPCAAV